MTALDGISLNIDCGEMVSMVGPSGSGKSNLRNLIGTHSELASDQCRWIPAQEGDRRIANQDRSARFFGTDFSIEHLEERDMLKYDLPMKDADFTRENLYK